MSAISDEGWDGGDKIWRVDAVIIRIPKFVFLISLFIFQASMLAKERPDFSGLYVLTPPKATKHNPEPPPARQLKVVQCDRILEATYIEGEKVRKCRYNLDGSESQNYTSGGAPSKDRAQFKGSDLVIRSVVSAQNGTTLNVTEKWRLSRDFKRLTVHYSAEAASGLAAGIEIVSLDDEYVRQP
jgi:hypothetical protein